MSAVSKRIDPWDVVYYRTDDEVVPADDFLDACPTKVSAQFAGWETIIAASFRVEFGSDGSARIALALPAASPPRLAAGRRGHRV